MPTSTPNVPEYPTCRVGGMWFHYERDLQGNDISKIGGMWTLAITYLTIGLASWDGAIFNYQTNLFMTALNNLFEVNGLVAYPGPPTPAKLLDPGEVAYAYYVTGQTIITAAQGPADDYALGCADTICGDANQWFNNETEQCEALVPALPLPVIPPPPAPPAPTPPATPVTPQPTGPNVLVPTDPDLDELGQCCQETQANLTAILNAILALQSGGNQADCCAAITAGLQAIAVQLTQLANAVATLAGGRQPVNLAPLVTAIEAINTTLGGSPIVQGTPAPVTITNAADFPTPVITSLPPDLTALVNAINRFAAIVDVKQSTIDWLVQQGYLDSAVAQVINPGAFGDSIVGIFRTYGWKALTWLSMIVGVDITGPQIKLSPLGETVAGYIANAVDFTLEAGAVPLLTPVTGLIDGIVNLLNPAGVVGPGNAGVNADLLLSETLSPVLIMNAITLVLSYFDVGGGEVLAHWIEVVAAFTGFEEIKEVIVGQRMQAGPIAAARIQAQALYRQTLPGQGDATSWAARGIVTPATAANWLSLGGLADAIQPAAMQAAYRGMNARQLLRLEETGLFAQADIQDELTFSGMRQVSQQRMLLAAPYLATNSQRTQLFGSIEKAYSAGLLADADVTGQIDSAENNFNRDDLILRKLHLDEQVALAKALETEYTTMYKVGLLTSDVYANNLAGIGLQQWKIDALKGVADASKAATLQRQMLAAERALERATQAKERTVAMKSYADGLLPAPALLAALLATGLTAEQAGAWTALAALQQQGSTRWKYGLQLTPTQAQILTERVTALTNQLKASLITDAQFVAQAQTLGLPAVWINALQANAHATATTPKQATLFPLNLGG